eukprot:SAG11_NODE_19698_length_461_cov_0.555249_1_plen_99_part_01
MRYWGACGRRARAQGTPRVPRPPGLGADSSTKANWQLEARLEAPPQGGNHEPKSRILLIHLKFVFYNSKFPIYYYLAPPSRSYTGIRNLANKVARTRSF